MSGYRDPDMLGALEQRVAKLEATERAERRGEWLRRFGTWLMWATLAAFLLCAVGGTVAGIRSCSAANDAELSRRCGEICRLHRMRVLWIETNTVPDTCVCGREGVDGGVIGAYRASDGQPGESP